MDISSKIAISCQKKMFQILSNNFIAVIFGQKEQKKVNKNNDEVRLFPIGTIKLIYVQI